MGCGEEKEFVNQQIVKLCFSSDREVCRRRGSTGHIMCIQTVFILLQKLRYSTGMVYVAPGMGQNL